MTDDLTLRRVVLLVALLNLMYFGVEFSFALSIKSVSLFANSVDFLEDASLNLLIMIGLSWSARNRARLGMVLAFILLVPALATVWALWQKVAVPSIPEPVALSLTGLGALVINVSCALIAGKSAPSRGQYHQGGFSVGT